MVDSSISRIECITIFALATFVAFSIFKSMYISMNCIKGTANGASASFSAFGSVPLMIAQITFGKTANFAMLFFHAGCGNPIMQLGRSAFRIASTATFTLCRRCTSGVAPIMTQRSNVWMPKFFTNCTLPASFSRCGTSRVRDIAFPFSAIMVTRFWLFSKHYSRNQKGEQENSDKKQLFHGFLLSLVPRCYGNITQNNTTVQEIKRSDLLSYLFYFLYF